MIVRTLTFVASLFLFVLSLELIKAGAATLEQHVQLLAGGEALASFGFGWLLACVLLSGSPVAAVSLGLLAGGTLSAPASYSMIIGSRVGASFVVLVVGAVYDFRSRGQRGGVYVGVLAFLTTVSVYLPALAIGYPLAASGLLDGISFGSGGAVGSAVEAVFGPIVELVSVATAFVHLPTWCLAIVGVALMAFAFRLFDRALPEVDPLGGRVGQMATTIFRPSIAFLFGMFVTALTLSVSVSLTLLVPLTVRGVVRRENLIPYILGANITTFVDTLLFSLIVNHPSAFAVVLCAVLVVSAISLPIVLLAYRPYERLIDGAASALSSRRSGIALFVCLVFLVPLLLLWLG